MSRIGKLFVQMFTNRASVVLIVFNSIVFLFAFRDIGTFDLSMHPEYLPFLSKAFLLLNFPALLAAGMVLGPILMSLFGMNGSNNVSIYLIALLTCSLVQWAFVGYLLSGFWRLQAKPERDSE